MDSHSLFSISTSQEFKEQTLETFRYQYANNEVYHEFCNHLGMSPKNVLKVENIPFLPISFFKSKVILTTKNIPETLFTSSGTTGSITSKHYVVDPQLYIDSFTKALELFYGNIKDYCILALLPSYLERQGSSLIYMADYLIKNSNHPKSGFYLNDLNKLEKTLQELEEQGQKTLLIGVSFALLDLAEKNSLRLNNTIVMETGGMKGRRKELIRDELHQILQNGFGLKNIHSEYGMTELLSQAYSQGNGIFKTPPWMKVLIRDTEDPLSLQRIGKTGGINIIDLANQHSCSFIATQDLGKMHADGSFEILGRFDHSDVRGCNLMVL
ncbi:acyl transferase [Cytophaga sp. FL35]|uniref:LuxE/PaaK family acyltransferase n=1 Tax=Cytophaga sp. FL35 TaxID=1904456 RepID=UPI00165393B5|nr:acyl transferase [Cytophaga sp. FL35]MBC6997613.1 acyl transferase [Cytophaga sp. FL35]